MIEFDKIGEDLFNKIRGRFPNVTIGDETGTVTNEPKKARFFDFDYKSGETTLGKVSVSIDEENGLTVIYSKDFIQNEDEMTQKKWYEFLRELRQFSKKRLLNFDVRDINKSNLNKRDYKFLATNRSGDDTMTESKLYGTNRVSYQKVGEARIMIKHTETINTESATGRTQKIGKIYIESPEGERFKYPYKHLSGARAMARHVAEGGTAYDDFGKHITGLSEELNKLRKFKNYMNRSSVMAESLEGYMDIVKERISTVKKTIENLQKPNYYKEAFDSFETPVFEEVPGDVAENWIDELTIKQFNEELADVFPYIYNLVKEGTKAKELGPDDLVVEEDEDKIDYKAPGVKKTKDGKYWAKSQSGTMKIFDKEDDAKKHAASNESFRSEMNKAAKKAHATAAEKRKKMGPVTSDTLADINAKLGNTEPSKKKTKEEFELEQAFEDTMGQFADHVCEDCGNPSWRTLGMTEEEIEEGERHGNSKIYDKCWKGWRKVPDKKRGEPGSCKKIGEADLEEAYIKTSQDAINTLGALRKIGKKIETGQDTYDGNLAGMYTNDVYDVVSWVENNLDTNDPKYKQVLAPVIELRKKAKGMETQPGSGKDARFGNEIVNTLYPLMQWIEMAAMDAKEDDLEEAYIKTSNDAIDTLGALRKIGKSIERGQGTYDGNLAGMYANDVYDVISWVENNLDINDPKYKQILAPVIELRKKAKGMEREPGSGKDARFGNEIVNTLYPLMQWIEMKAMDAKEGNAYAKAVRQAKMDGKKKGDKVKGPDGDEITLEKEAKTPLGEFILSYYDRETGEFPKGETAVLTMVEKDYGEQFIEPAKAFIEQINQTFEAFQMRTHPQQMETDSEFDRMKELAGLR